MLSRVPRVALLRSAAARRTCARRSRLSQAVFFSTEETPKVPTTAEEELALTPKVQTVLDQILALNMIEIAELSHAIQVCVGSWPCTCVSLDGVCRVADLGCCFWCLDLLVLDQVWYCRVCVPGWHGWQRFRWCGPCCR